VEFQLACEENLDFETDRSDRCQRARRARELDELRAWEERLETLGVTA
jgi:hypothetical protein